MRNLSKFLLKLTFIILLFVPLFFLQSHHHSIYDNTPNLSYKSIIPEPRMKNLKMIGRVDKYGVRGATTTAALHGKVLRVLRFQNITQTAEEHYGIPKNLLLAMMMQESGGVDLLLNSRNDGGAGLCHIQPSVASEFGLKTYQNCKELICYTHGKALRQLIIKSKHDRKKLIVYDEQLHPIINIDAVARMLSVYKKRRVQSISDKWETAIYYYAGKRNYKKYWANVQYFRNKLNNPKTIDAVEKEFNRRNTTLLINGRKADFDSYIQAHQQQNINYGLREYK